MNNGKIGIVIVNYNGEKYQNDALRTIYESSYTNFEVIIVDSASKDKSIEYAKRDFPNVHILQQDENVGVAKGNNIGTNYAINTLDSEYVLLINNDVEIDKDTIKSLVEYADKNTVTVPKIYYYDKPNMLWFAGGMMRWEKGEPYHRGNFETDTNQYDKNEAINYSPTCCMLLHRDIITKVGAIDEKMFMYFDDTDLCVRIVQNGFRILYVPSSYLWHKVSSSGGGMDSKIFVYYNFRNKFYFMDKYKDKVKFPAKLYTYAKLLTKFIISPVYKKNDKYILKAWIDYRKGLMGRCDNL